MKKMLTKLALTLMLAGLSTSYADDIQLGIPGYGGTGCPAGTVSATLSPDQKELSLIFDQFVAEAGQSSGKSIDRKSCNLAIPVHVPQGFSVSIIDVDYRGFVSLPSQARATLTASYFFAGQRGPTFSRNFVGRTDQDYLFTNTLGVAALVWSRCGDDVNLRINSSMLVRTNSRREDALATVDSVDLSAGIIYKLQWRRC